MLRHKPPMVEGRQPQCCCFLTARNDEGGAFLHLLEWIASGKAGLQHSMEHHTSAVALKEKVKRHANDINH